jgi:very-short-patch-repair endonuclease
MPERILWRRLRDRRLAGAHFRRQHPLGPYIVDFFCAPARLAVELDGVTHDEQAGYDERRTRWLEQNHGCRVLRFSNQDVMRHLEAVLETILRALHEQGHRDPHSEDEQSPEQ